MVSDTEVFVKPDPLYYFLFTFVLNCLKLKVLSNVNGNYTR